MKIRNGFVSNSSSSSFIIGIGKIFDLEKATAFATEYKRNCDIVSLDLGNGVYELAQECSDANCSISGNTITVESFDGCCVSAIIDSVTNKYLVVSYAGNEGDHAFSNDEDDWECDYDITDEFFDSTELKYLDINESNGVSNYTSAYGAGRNG